MNSSCRELLSLIASNGPIPAARVRERMAAEDLELLGLTARLLREHSDRLDASIEPEAVREFAVRYYRRCFLEDPATEFAENRRRAGHSLCRWFFKLAESDAVGHEILEGFQGLLAELYRSGDEALRESVVTHCLEHLFESRRIAAMFADWQDDPVLGEAFAQALEWGEGFWPR